MISGMRIFLITFLTLMQFIGTVVLDLIATITVYMFLRTYDTNLFGWLVSLSIDVFTLFSNQIERFFPQAANHANATLLGEMSGKAILLLLIGLTVGAFMRFVFWGIKCFVRKDVSLG